MSDMEKKDILGQEKDLEADELNEVAGGDCGCLLGGGGASNSWSKTCVCVIGGGGEYNDRGEDIYGRKCRCACASVGAGVD